MMRWTNGSCSNDHLSWTRLSKSKARRWRSTSWLARSAMPFSSLEYAWQKIVQSHQVVKAQWQVHYERLVLWSVTLGEPNRPIWLSIIDAVSRAVVDSVGNNSTQREKASMITRMYSFPCASLGSGPILWPKPPNEMTVVNLSYLTTAILYYSNWMSDQSRITLHVRSTSRWTS